MNKIILQFIFLLTVVSVGGADVCRGAGTNAFGERETISYQLYFNWKFIWIKAGTASMTTIPAVYYGKPAYKTSLITKSSPRVDKFFMMRDTIMSYCAEDLTPLYYRKGAREGKRYYVDEVWYTASGNKSIATMRHLTSSGDILNEKHTYDRDVSDMVNSFMRVRNMDASKWKVGHVEPIFIAGGTELTQARLIYKGRKTVKGDDGKKYPCLILSYNEKDDGKWKEIVKFFVTDDKRHIPIRLDLNLRFGTAKAFITSIR